MSTWTHEEALEHILRQVEQHAMWCPAPTAAAMLGDWSGIEKADDSTTALTCEIAAVCRMALGLESPYAMP